MPRHKLTKEESAKGGTISKRKSFDKELKSALEVFLSMVVDSSGEKESRGEQMIRAAYNHWLDGNSKPMEILMNRGFGPVKTDGKRDDKCGKVLVVVPEQQKKYIEGGNDE
jgi:hypothetical protein